LSGIGSLKGFVATLLTLTIVYALALMLLIPIGFLLGVYLISLFGNELFTQSDFFLFPGMFFIVIGGVMDLIAIVLMIGIKSGLSSAISEDLEKENYDDHRIKYISISILLMIIYFVAGALIFKDEIGLIFFPFWVGIVFTFFFLKWKVIDIPAKALHILGNENGLKWGRISAIPFLILLFSFFSLLISFRFEEAPTGTIVLVYLEVLFALSVLINIISIAGMVKAINGEIGHLETNGIY